MSIYIIGHKNPDTDSICSAIGYAAFKMLLKEADMRLQEQEISILKLNLFLKSLALTHQNFSKMQQANLLYSLTTTKWLKPQTVSLMPRCSKFLITTSSAMFRLPSLFM